MSIVTKKDKKKAVAREERTPEEIEKLSKLEFTFMDITGKPSSVLSVSISSGVLSSRATAFFLSFFVTMLMAAPSYGAALFYSFYRRSAFVALL